MSTSDFPVFANRGATRNQGQDEDTDCTINICGRNDERQAALGQGGYLPLQHDDEFWALTYYIARNTAQSRLATTGVCINKGERL